ncbi:MULTISPECIES: TatD family hydrolase [unclassified Agarivorans]|uniref:TatD family hydrolase n=1 Tax=unclassified Agarivorans TaxID=2636026 RepID=UPI0026E35932|nr:MULTISPECIES: YchF/TatD family DNA exonuclease [unclassified Agarivorans]MDO6685999.1 YchF/TatD family DNA exonuclease [Agarivorans sp. 3_MG-2023]MDO6713863.1 YchF/TatD family DNA exonuclease [Agarivorans sp. 2_MG-2023]
MLVDSHCHLDRLDYKDKHQNVAEALAKAKNVGVDYCLAVAISPDKFPSMMDKVGEFDNVFASCGMHPLYVQDQAFDLELMESYLSHPKVVAVGETGLDYFYAKEHKELQHEVFTQHIKLAVKHQKPLIIHTRDAREDTLNLLTQHNAERCKGVLHCFTESLEMAQAAIEMGFYISASGIISFNSAKELQNTFKQLPLDRILVETDSPYLAPVPHRGDENQPAYTLDVAKCLAKIKGVSLEEVAEQTTKNFFDLFSLAKP